jgi:hypothetical protein
MFLWRASLGAARLRTEFDERLPLSGMRLDDEATVLDSEANPGLGAQVQH